MGGTCICAQGFQQCGATCIDILADRENCGDCGVACGSLQVCSFGSCVDDCPAGLVVCGGACVDIESNGQHCGGCGTSCTGELACIGGTCGCIEGETACGDSCRNLNADALHCGACDLACQGDLGCRGGVCVCPQGLAACGSACLNLDSDPMNCGSCGNACGPGGICTGGSCACGEGLTACGETCVRTEDDDRHCGTCDNACSSDRECNAGSCACPEGTAECDGRCVVLAVDEDHCGSCDNACEPPARCFDGVCATCAEGETRCGDACVNPLVSDLHCGGCGVACGPGETCIDGACGCEDDHLPGSGSAAAAVQLPIGDLTPPAGRSGAYSHLRLCPETERWFRLEVPGDGGRLIVELSGDCGSSTFNPVVEVVESDGRVRSTATGGGPAGCPRLSADVGRGTRYFRLRAPAGASGRVDLGVRFQELKEREFNDSRGSANGPYHRTFRMDGFLDEDWRNDRQDFYSLVLHHVARVSVQTSGCSAWNNVELQRSNGGLVRRGTRTGFCGTITNELVMPGQYYVRVYIDSPWGDEWGSYKLDVTASPTFEVEPNDTPATATSLGAAPVSGEGALTRSDVDHWRFSLAASTNLVVQTRGPFHGCEADTVVELRSADGATLLAATGGGGEGVHGGAGTCGVLRASTHPELQNLPAGEYIVAVRGHNGARGPYLLNIMPE